QVGEFSFIPGNTAQSLGLIPGSGNSVLVAAAVVSISLNPFIFRRMLAFEPLLAQRPLLAKWLAADVRSSELARTKSLRNECRIPVRSWSAMGRSVKRSRDC